MQEEKHIEALKEVKRLIDIAMRDPDGLLLWQRVIMTVLSLGVQNLVEIWLHRSTAIKPGATIKHEWFSSEDRKLRLKMSGVLTKDFRKLKNADAILSLAREIEKDRNSIVYGSPLINDSVIREKLDVFLELKKSVESVSGDIQW